MSECKPSRGRFTLAIKVGASYSRRQEIISAWNLISLANRALQLCAFAIETMDLVNSQYVILALVQVRLGKLQHSSGA